MATEFINAAIAGIYTQAASLIEGAHDTATLKRIVAEAKCTADKIIATDEASLEKQQPQDRLTVAAKANQQ